ncbi:MAG TPA: CHASE3 domain-containing protein [Patescibacteria group bacterium]|nr:CHASE3 domain-containing protein [Patescibacteria group bacterium]
MTFKSKLVVGVAAALAVLVAVGVLSYNRILDESTDAQWVDHTHQVIDTLDAVLTDLIDAETGQRGFLLTGETSYLQPYNSALAHLNSDFDRARKLTADNPSQQRRLARMSPLIAAKLAELKETIGIRRSKGLIVSADMVRTDTGKRRMDQIRSVIARMKQEEEGLLQERLKASASASQKTKFVILGGNLLGFLFLFAAGMLIHQEMGMRQRIEYALRVSEDKFKGILESGPDAIVIVNQTGRIVLVNSRTEELFGYPRAALLDKPVEMLMPERFRGLHVDHRGTYLSEPRTRPMGMGMELLGRRQDGTEFPVAISLGPLQGREGMLVSSAIRDITERKRIEEEIRIRNAQLEAANKELEAFCYSVSHDLRAPLRSIDGFSQALLEDQAGQIDDQGKAYLHRIRAATQRMGILIDDLLNLSRVTRAEILPKPTNLSEMARSVAGELRRQEPGREVEFVVAPDLQASADPRLMRIVLENLLSNSWKFTSKRERARIEFGCTQENGSSAFFVRDNGAGFDPAYSDRLFGAFQRLHSTAEFPGTGVGLATVQRIVLRHGGKVWAEGAMDRGATFYFQL